MTANTINPNITPAQTEVMQKIAIQFTHLVRIYASMNIPAAVLRKTLAVIQQFYDDAEAIYANSGDIVLLQDILDKMDHFQAPQEVTDHYAQHYAENMDSLLGRRHRM
jgi:hypothetical protein